MSKGRRYYSADDIADIKNARGCMVPWWKIAQHYCDSEDAVKQAVGEATSAPVQASNSEFDLWSVDRLDGVL
ncbi:MAG: hypothetical protein KDB01_05360 [Planctomycetaceae bacterium]|nr:hypothetical protein [Planctomycetaceae bacterium]